VDPLSPDEMALWHAWKRAAERVRTSVAADITAQTGLSDPDFAVLTRVVEIGGGRLRQNQLAELMGYHRSRLSHHLSRMEDRGLITRRAAGSGVEVIITEAGQEAVDRARPIHAAAVRRHLIGPLSDADREAIQALLERLDDLR
jgi:DNA-binding MarR family transcriptional regulator